MGFLKGRNRKNEQLEAEVFRQIRTKSAASEYETQPKRETENLHTQPKKALFIYKEVKSLRNELERMQWEMERLKRKMRTMEQKQNLEKMQNFLIENMGNIDEEVINLIQEKSKP